MRIHIIACRIFERELGYLSAVSDNQIDLTWFGRGLHNTPEVLCERLIGAVDELYRQIEARELEHRPDAIVLGYGLCSKAVVGIRCRDIPIVIPRTDDCIALFMGSQERYLKEFADAHGAYWLNSGWLEQSARLFDSDDLPANLRRAGEEAERKGWRLRELDGDLRLLRMMTEGTWNDEEFLILKPGETVAADYSGKKLRAVRDGE